MTAIALPHLTADVTLIAVVVTRVQQLAMWRVLPEVFVVQMAKEVQQQI